MPNPEPQAQGSQPVVTPVPQQPVEVTAQERSNLMRTMAKDMAALAGTPQPTPIPAAAPKKESVGEETVEGVSLPKAEHPFFEKILPHHEEVSPEAMELPSLQEAQTIVQTEAKQPASTPTLVRPQQLPPKPLPPVQAAPVQPPSSSVEERESALERMREKLRAQQAKLGSGPQPKPAPIPTSEKTPETKAPTPLLEEAQLPPVSAPTPPVPQVAKQPEWQNIPVPAPSIPPPTPSVPAKDGYREPVESTAPPRPIAPRTPDALHTYTSDFADRIDTKSASTFSVLAAEQDAQAPRVSVRPPEKVGKAAVAIAMGLVLLVLGGGGILAVYHFVMTAKETPIASLTVPSIVFADEYRELSGTGSALMEALAASQNAALTKGQVLVAYILTQTSEGTTPMLATPVGGLSLIRAMYIPAPEILLRNIQEASTLGIVTTGDDSKPFFALRIDSYERTYAGMLTWEPAMLRDLGTLYPLYPAETTSVTSGTSTASTSAPVTTKQAVPLTRFADAIVANRDVRVLRDSEGRSLILYGYVDKRTLLIVRDEAAFETLIGRLNGK